MAPKPGEQLLKAYYNKAGPLTLHTQSVMVKLTAPTTVKGDTAELDFVAVLDTSGSMQGHKLKQMQAAMKLVIRKLGTEDRLAIVNFGSTAETPYELNKVKLQGDEKGANKAVDKLEAKGDTNIEAGLKRGMEILSGRKGREKFRAACIFLMSDGVQNRGDARKLLGQMPGTDDHYWTVHTFGFGEKHDETLLWEIAQKSHAGVYHHVLENEDLNDLSAKAFAPSLAQYRSISMLGVKVTVTPRDEAKASILRVYAGDGYRVDTPTKGGPWTWTIKFGDLAREENRRIMIDVQLPVVQQNDKAKPVLEVKYAYTLPKNKKNTNPKETEGPRPLVVEIARDGKAKSSDKNPDVEREVARYRQADFLVKVREFADKKDMAGARREADTALKELNGLKDPQGEFVIDALRTELENIEDFLGKYDDYNKLGRAYLLACLSSHHRQRYTSRGGADEVPLFLTERMKKYQRHAHDFHKNPNATHI